MLKLRLIFYYTTAGIALGFLFCMLMFFNVALEMMLGLGLVMYIFTGFGLMVAIAKTRLDWKYSFFYIELAADTDRFIIRKITTIPLYYKRNTRNHKSCIRDTYLFSLHV